MFWAYSTKRSSRSASRSRTTQSISRRRVVISSSSLWCTCTRLRPFSLARKQAESAALSTSSIFPMSAPKVFTPMEIEQANTRLTQLNSIVEISSRSSLAMRSAVACGQS